jgi:hypothetical protein
MKLINKSPQLVKQRLDLHLDDEILAQSRTPLGRTLFAKFCCHLVLMRESKNGVFIPGQMEIRERRGGVAQFRA